MKSTYLVAFIFLFMIAASVKTVAQEEKPVRIKIMKDVNGETKVFEKSYSSKEEMENDPEFKKFQEESGEANIFILPGKGNFTWSSDSTDTKFMIIQSETIGEGDAEIMHSEDHVIHLGDGSARTFVIKGGDADTIKSNVFFFKGDSSETAFEFKSSPVKSKWIVRSQSEPAFHMRTLRGHKNMSINDPTENEVRSAGLSADKQLNPRSIEYVLNTTEGTLTVRLETGKGSLSVAVSNSNGNQIFSEELSNFNGQYRKTINLSGQEAGTYFLEIRQGTKALFKKIIIE